MDAEDRETPSAAGDFPAGADNNPEVNDQDPLRMELFSEEQRRERGRAVGHEHVPGDGTAGTDRLLQRLQDNEEVLQAERKSLVDDATAKATIPPAGEWLIDNYYLIEEQISLCERHLPKKFLLELPRLGNPEKKGVRRVYDLAEHIIAYGDGRVDVEDVTVFITAYQEVHPLRLGELWAIPIMLRLALIENIRRMAVAMGKNRQSRQLASRWAEEIIRVERDDPKNLILAVADMARTKPQLDGPFVAEFKRRLQSRGSGMKLPLQWVEQNLGESDRGIDEVVNEENHQQALTEMSMRNCINSLRNLNSTDWMEFVESLSVVERTLREDPADVYSKMDFDTRDDYRRVVETLAKKSGRDETEVAQACLDLAREAAAAGSPDDPAAHVGYYLIGPGERTLMRAVGFKASLGDFLRHASSRVTLFLYLGAIVFLTGVFTVVTAAIAHMSGVEGGMLLFLTLLLACATSHLAVGLVNYAATQIVKPRTLPRLNFARGIPSEQRTLVVVPVIISSARNVRHLLRNLEMHYLNNRGDNVHFGLLTDFADAPERDMPHDARILEHCRRGVEKLNARYPDDNGDNFFLFHRPRKWNPVEGVWMGWERKRGKLEDLNRYLRAGDPDIFSCVAGRVQVLPNVKYVITLDADTVMARDSAWQLTGAMAHPLIRPQYDEAIGRVVKGHGILQPRVESCLSGVHRSHYARMSSHDIGIDPYTRASSDVYQDLFDEGSFIGKGIYDVELFDRALGGRFPDNKILSHDLLEGCVVRSGLVNDVKLYEDPPATYLADVMRRHRWVRGDWQIASYLVSGETRRGFKATSHPLNMLSQWKVFDNLRRSLTGVFLLLLLVTGLTILDNPVLYLLVVGCVFIIPVLVGAAWGLVRKSPDNTIFQHVRSLGLSTLREAVQVGFKFSCLPFEAYMNMDAIVRSLWRQGVSGKHLLQWNPYDNSHNADATRFLPILRRMWIGPAAAATMTAVLAKGNPLILFYAAPLFVLWFLSPLFAAWLSRPLVQRRESLSAGQSEFLRLTARRIWLFFEDFVNEAENWLPPDNFQEYPVGKTAHRTSPTNMGLSLLANLSAFDFGFATAGVLVRRTEQALLTMERLDRYRGHFYNWYDTVTLSVLRPAYVSSVDSGNLAGHLLVLASGLKSLVATPVALSRMFEGLRDTLLLAAREAGDRDSPILRNFEAAKLGLNNAIVGGFRNLAEYRAHLAKMADLADRIRDDCAQCAEGEERCRRWLDAFGGQCRDALEELDALAPWAGLLHDHEDWRELPILSGVPTLLDVADMEDKLGDSLGSLHPELLAAIRQGAGAARDRLLLLRDLVERCEELADIDFDFLYDPAKRFLSIGYNVDDRRLDASYYDLLASEARLAAYVGIAQNKLPQKAWWAMGRMLTLSGRHPLLISWSGSMFEYLMPLLVMPTYKDTLLDETYRACVAVQMEYGDAKKTPWGISESGYNIFDSDQNYQYRAFGVPELGLKHGLSDDLVIAPYASVLATMVFPARSCRNLERLAAAGCLTSYGFYEALDYTPSRLPHGASRVPVRSYMAHHQGMSLVALGQTLLGRPMHRRFEENPLLRSALMLLQEMAPAEKAMYYHSSYSPEIRPAEPGTETPMRVVTGPGTPSPEVQLLSNGNYHVMVTAAGSGYSRWRDLSLTRWREDATRDNWGTFCYLRDREGGEPWSTTFQPTRKPAKRFEAIFSEGKAEFHRRDADFDCRTEIVVSPEDDVEIRRLRITNRSPKRKVLDVTSYAEVALNAQAADDSHQAFSKLFVETAIVPDRQAIVCSRRPRDAKEKTPLMFHMLAVRGSEGGTVTYETDRLRFLGRGRDASDADAVFGEETELANSQGAVLDPIVSIRTPVTLDPGGTAVIDLTTGVAADRETLLPLLEKYQDQRMADKAFDLAWSHGQLLLRQLNISDPDAQRYCRLAGSVIYANPALRADPAVISRNRRGQSGLWSYAISGDVPIVLLKVGETEELGLVGQMLQAHSYWRQKGLATDLVIWNEDKTGYRQSLHDQIMSMAGTALEDGTMERPGGIFLRPGDRVPEEDRVLVQSVARVVLSGANGMLEDQLRRVAKAEASSTSTTIVQYRKAMPHPSRAEPERAEELVFDNGYGGFADAGREYVVVVDKGRTPPTPWANVIANATFGTLVSESGSSCTWGENAHEFRLTPWDNDPVTDATGEALYIRDENSGEFWSPTPAPCRTGGRFVARHGFGYSVFEHRERDISSTLTIHVDPAASVKFMTLKLRNDSDQRRNLSAAAYVEWVLGDLRTRTAMHVVTGVDPRTGALFATNNYHDEFRGRVAFLDTDDPGRGVGGDRRRFLGRNGSAAHPQGMRRSALSGRTGAGLDPCGAVQVKCNLSPGQEREIVFRIGLGRDADDARRLVKEFRGVRKAHESLEAAKTFWRKTLGVIQVQTPDTAFNYMANGWLLYQALSCRFWGRNATYQSGGAFGFRDQLQDSLALVYSHPELVRRHLLECAGRQFVEGDVMHWWHPPAGRGVRTRCSDDYLWLPYATERYIAVTGDKTVLDETVPFIQGRPVPEGEESYYDLPQTSDEKGTLFEHCRRAVSHGLRMGRHGLPLMGTGDWNDGMDRVGCQGKGESVWLAFFLYDTLSRFEPLARGQGDDEFAALCRDEAARLRESIHANAWDGEWYRRAYFDDGTPLGSAGSPECRIDSLAQSWAVISGAGDPARAAQGMENADRLLVDREHKLVKLFDPPFDRSDLNPGYIKGYVPGVRENGGQYTHGAVWLGIAQAMLGNRDQAWEIQALLNPVNHALDAAWTERYKTEPYVAAADVYSAPQHQGRGGWSWYTGSASWLYRFMIENILGFTLEKDRLSMRPCAPRDWKNFLLTYRRGEGVYEILMDDAPEGGAENGIEVDESPGGHRVRMRLSPE